MLSMCTLTPTSPHTLTLQINECNKNYKKRFQFFRESLSILKKYFALHIHWAYLFSHLQNRFLVYCWSFHVVDAVVKGKYWHCFGAGNGPRISYILGKLLTYTSLGFWEISSSCIPLHPPPICHISSRHHQIWLKTYLSLIGEQTHLFQQ